jgi:putative zinc finger/helix-turn-helix YgiT family protein
MSGEPSINDPDEYALVLKAFAMARSERGYVGGFVEWKSDRVIAKARGQLADLDGFTPDEIRRKSVDFVNNGGQIRQSGETREEYAADYRFKYIVILPCDDFPRGVFVEFVLVDDDPEGPVVHIVSAHRNC